MVFVCVNIMTQDNFWHADIFVHIGGNSSTKISLTNLVAICDDILSLQFVCHIFVTHAENDFLLNW